MPAWPRSTWPATATPSVARDPLSAGQPAPHRRGGSEAPTRARAAARARREGHAGRALRARRASLLAYRVGTPSRLATSAKLGVSALSDQERKSRWSRGHPAASMRHCARPTTSSAQGAWARRRRPVAVLTSAGASPLRSSSSASSTGARPLRRFMVQDEPQLATDLSSTHSPDITQGVPAGRGPRGTIAISCATSR